MTVRTVADLIKALQGFDPETPVLKGDVSRPLYHSITVLEGMTFEVKPLEMIGTDLLDQAMYTDGREFEAVIL